MAELSPAEWAEVEALFARALELPTEERPGFLLRECRQEKVRREAASLLDHAHHEPLTFAAAVETALAGLESDVNPDEQLIGARLGPYKLVGIAGYGGMGAVYRASREDHEFQQQVAIKLIRAAAESPNTQQRFRQERQILARLSHPNIARLLDGGSTPEGVPYLVMEFIEGEPITAWCERQSLGVEQRLRIFLLVCEGVSAAHRERVVHRDIKPANILVTADGVPKLLDFGIAKMLDADERGGALTATRFQAMTPDYASPEQVRGEQVTEGADVYALGLVLYEVLTGRKAQKFPDYSQPTIVRVVCHEEPVAPATLGAQFSGDLDNIIRMAIRKEPDRRYRSVADLGEDVRRHLSGKPIAARPDTLAYRSAKFLGRNRAAARAGLVSALCVAGACALVYWLGEPSRPPRVLEVVQLTQGARVSVNSRIATDGSKVYFSVRNGEHADLASIPVAGGLPSPFLLPAAMSDPGILDISPDGLNLLIETGYRRDSTQTVWIVPTNGGAPQSVAHLVIQSAAWSPDGSRIFFLSNNTLFGMKADGRDRRKLVEVPDGSYEVRDAPAPLPNVLRLSVFTPDMRSSSIWQVAPDGSGMHPLVPGQHSAAAWPDAFYSGDWIHSGRYYLLRSRRDNVSSFWALHSGGGFSPGSGDPIRLYSTPLQTRSFTASPDGKRIFFAASQERSQFVRYDSKRAQFLPFLPGISGRYLSFSPDQRHVAYTTVPEDALWTSLVDGRERRQLIPSPGTRSSSMRVFNPRWSPDGNSITFHGSVVGKPTQDFEVSAGGGRLQVIPGHFGSDPSWSPAGDKLLVTNLVRRGESGQPGLYILDPKSQKKELLPDSEIFAFAVWSPNPRYIAATRSGTELRLFDFKSRKWYPLAAGKDLSVPFWSVDGKWVYFQDTGAGDEAPIFRVRTSDGKTERLMGSKQVPQSDFTSFILSAIAPDGTPVAALGRTNSDVYALDVDLP